MKHNTQNIEPSSAQPKLAPPGAGVPFMQLLVMRFYLGPFKAARSDWSESRRQFEEIHAKILRALEGLSDEQLGRKVLVPAQIGLEDSSRYWSIAMALEHLVIVHREIAKGIIALTHGTVPPQKADTAKVKPLGTMSPAQSVAEFKQVAATLLTELDAKIGDRASPLKHTHPWFGPFTARQWYWLLGQHAVIHYLQIKNIKKGLL